MDREEILSKIQEITADRLGVYGLGAHSQFSGLLFGILRRNQGAYSLEAYFLITYNS